MPGPAEDQAILCLLSELRTSQVALEEELAVGVVGVH
jgi:hypothetical protein